MELRIKEICKEKGTSITGLAAKLGMKQESLSRIINGNPTIGTLQRIADGLGVCFIEMFESDCPKCGMKFSGVADIAATPVKADDGKQDAGIGLFESVLRFADLKRDEGKKYQNFIIVYKHLNGYGINIPLRDVDKAYMDGFGEYLSHQVGRGGKKINPIHYCRVLKTVLYAMQNRDTGNGMKKWF